MTSPEPLSCAVCDRPIGERTRHWIIIEDHRVICRRCGSSTGYSAIGNSRGYHHNLVYPGCGVEWHDIHDHPEDLQRQR